MDVINTSQGSDESHWQTVIVTSSSGHGSLRVENKGCPELLLADLVGDID